MRLFVIPISTRRALIYSRAISKGQTPKELSWTDRATGKVAEKWAQWEEAEKGWKKHLVTWGNRVQQRIPFEEWGLKSIPSLNAQRRMDETHGTKKIDVLFPGNAIKPGKLQAILLKIATERQELHRKKMWWSFIAAPITAPIALIPIVPNIPFFYLVYRGWSHWRALNGSKHLQYLVENNLLNPVSFPGLEDLYAKRVSYAMQTPPDQMPISSMVEDLAKKEDRLLLRISDAKKLASILDAPELSLEAERAIAQVEEQLKPKGPSTEEGHKKDT
ncbi:mitochondrial K+-H+ exchange-related family protein [Aspergillus candidus]|uniref:Mitochondrial K+-H+ exchange-related-domain-containing protein n=1 Tax=Aspergillus candidus TaxID=41067 RepID=A0A2I2F6Z7_ASPCN|nr:mitochondrial K+-H+ exchange-related-domain-containing protein [Aspergillus candidus]PLB36423.1 mitochondrial K+-H+ exchange-related-domain-containing protein [Aspergillus candidus]